jgi:AAHS family 4-hydroxybenzoate transporter-like MFS transporter
MAGYGAGAAGGGLVAAFLIDLYGWRSGFWLGGLLPLLCAPLLALFLPESLRFRVRRNPLDPAIPQTLKSLSPSLILTGTEKFVGGEKEEGKSTLFGVLADGRAVATVLIWLGFFLAMGNGAVLASWTTTFFKQMGGVPIQEFGKVLAIGSLAAAVGNLTVGFLLDTFRARSVLIFCFLGYSISLVGLGFLPFGTFGLTFSLFGQYYFMNAGTSGIAILTSQYYPTEVRGTGMSWGIGAGRIGGIVGPLLGGLALTNHLGLEQTFFLIALVPLAVLVVMLIFLHLTVRGPATPIAVKMNPAQTRA